MNLFLAGRTSAPWSCPRWCCWTPWWRTTAPASTLTSSPLSSPSCHPSSQSQAGGDTTSGLIGSYKSLLVWRIRTLRFGSGSQNLFCFKITNLDLTERFWSHEKLKFGISNFLCENSICAFCCNRSINSLVIIPWPARPAHCPADPPASHLYCQHSPSGTPLKH